MQVRKKLGLVVLGTGLGLVALEISLQVVSYVGWVSEPSPPPPRTDAASRVVLCIGDSFTEGLGASDAEHAYPRQAETLLAASATGATWRVLNCGRAGSNSRELLAKLPRQLADYRPDLVYVLTGYNDFWSQREPQDGFPIEFRTLRLLSMIVHWIGGGDDGTAARPESPAQAPFVGDWHAGDVWFRFTSDGRIETSGGELDFYWSWLPGELVLRDRTRGDESRASWRIDTGALVLSGGFLPAEIRLDRGPLLRNGIDRGQHALRHGDLDGAQAQFEACLDVAELVHAARHGLVSVFARRGQVDVARDHLAQLRTAFAAAPTDQLRSLLIESSFAVGAVDAALVLVGQILTDGSVDDNVVRLVFRRGLDATDRTPLLGAIDRALARTDLTEGVRIGLLGAKAELRDDEPLVAVRSLIEALQLGGGEQLFQRTVMRDPERFTRERVDRALEELQLGASERTRVIDVFESALTADDRTVEVLAGNLRRVVRMCREAGAEPVLLNYPIAHPEVEQVVRELATAIPVGWIDLKSEFATRLRSASYSDYFILDGHCNDRGYAVLGELVARDVRERLR